MNLSTPLRKGLSWLMAGQLGGAGTASMPSADPNGVAYNAAITAAARTLSSAERQANLTAAAALTAAGLTASKVEIGLTGWGVAAANLIKYYSRTSGTEGGIGGNTHAAGGVTFGASGYFYLGLTPSVDGITGLGCYIKNTISNTGSKVDFGSSTNTGSSAWDMLLNYAGTYYVDYGNNSTARVSGTGQTLPGLYTMQKLSSITQRFVRTTSGGQTIINTTAISGGSAPIYEMTLGCGNTQGSPNTTSQGTYAAWVWAKTTLSTSEWDALNSILIAWLLELGWIT